MEEGERKPIGKDGKEEEQQTNEAQGEEAEGLRWKDFIGAEEEVGFKVVLRTVNWNSH